MSKPLQILLVEDHVVVREALKALLHTQEGLHVVGQASDGESAVRLAAELKPDVVVLDVMLPTMSGAETTRQMLRISPHSRVLALTQYDDKTHVRALLEAGAKGYVLKRSAADDLIRAIRTVAAGGTFFDAGIFEKVTTELLPAKVKGQDSAEELSERETQVLRLIAEGYTNKEIAHQLEVSVKSVETYKARAMEKLGLQSRAALVRYALGQGWLRNT